MGQAEKILSQSSGWGQPKFIKHKIQKQQQQPSSANNNGMMLLSPMSWVSNALSFTTQSHVPSNKQQAIDLEAAGYRNSGTHRGGQVSKLLKPGLEMKNRQLLS
eukprot:PhF_6_TR35717/c0_g1_i2/m.51859